MIYQTLADYYDALVSDEAAIDQWVEWIESFHPGKKFLELACGTGEITLKLKENHQVSALDLSDEMVLIASEKDTGKEIDFSCRDMRDLNGLGMFDAIGCFCDSINYLENDEELAGMIQQVYEHLNEDGLFLFDMHSMDRLEEFRDAYEETGTFDDGTQVQWIIESEDNTIYQDFAFYLKDETVQEHHVQHVFEPEKVLEILDPSFEVLDIRTDFDQPGIVSGEKTFIVCRRKKQN